MQKNDLGSPIPRGSETENSKFGVIDAILAYSEQHKSEIKAHLDDQKPQLNAGNFFTDTNPNGIVSKAAFLSYAATIGKQGLISFQQFLTDVIQKTKLEIPMFTSIGKKHGDRYYWITQRGINTSRGYKLMYFDGVDRLIAAYQHDACRLELTLEALFEEARKS